MSFDKKEVIEALKGLLQEAYTIAIRSESMYGARDYRTMRAKGRYWGISDCIERIENTDIQGKE